MAGHEWAACVLPRRTACHHGIPLGVGNTPEEKKGLYSRGRGLCDQRDADWWLGRGRGSGTRVAGEGGLYAQGACEGLGVEDVISFFTPFISVFIILSGSIRMV